ncbi:choice-of-anchor E domain-containing protein [Coraliomargarita sp. W4R53]
MKTLHKLLTVPAALLASAVISSAASNIQTFSFTGETLDITGSEGITPTFNKFDTNTGTLTEVKITYSVTIASGALIIDNDGASEIAASYDATLAGSLSDPEFGVFFPAVAISDQISGSETLAAENGDGPGVIDGNGPDGVTVSLVGMTDTSTSSLTSGTFFDSFKSIGAGTFDLTYTASRDFNIDAGAAEGGFTTSTANGTFTVEYIYTAVPEASAFAAISGLVALGFVCTRRRRK